MFRSDLVLSQTNRFDCLCTYSNSAVMFASTLRWPSIYASSEGLSGVLVNSRTVWPCRLFMKPKFTSMLLSAFMWHFISFVHNLVLSRKHLATLRGTLGGTWRFEPTAKIEELGEGRIRATWGWISVDRGSKATLPLTMPRRVFKSSAKDSAHRPLGRELRGGRPRHFGRTGLANGTGPWGRKRP